MRRASSFMVLLVTLGGCCSTTRTYDDLAWTNAVRAAQTVAESRGGYDFEVAVYEDEFCATWRQELHPIADILGALLLISSCDPWYRLELDRDDPLEVSARVVNVDFFFFFFPVGSTNETSEAHLLEDFERELTNRQEAEPGTSEAAQGR